MPMISMLLSRSLKDNHNYYYFDWCAMTRSLSDDERISMLMSGWTAVTTKEPHRTLALHADNAEWKKWKFLKISKISKIVENLHQEKIQA